MSSERSSAWPPARSSPAHLTLKTLARHVIAMIQTRTLKIKTMQEHTQGHQTVCGGLKIQIQVPGSRRWVLFFLSSSC